MNVADTSLCVYRGREGTRLINTPCMRLNCPLWFYC